MANEMIHGLKPALQFLSGILAEDSGRNVTLGSKLSNSRLDKYDYWFRFSDNSRPITFFAPGWAWKSIDHTPDKIDWSLYTFTIRPKILHRRGIMVTDLQLEFVGIEAVPGLSVLDKVPYAKAAFFSSGYFPSTSPVWLEYRRRFTIEAADSLQKIIAARIKKNIEIPPYVDD